MRHFQQIAAGIDVLPLLHALQRQPRFWNADTFRTTYPNTPHGEVDDILLRFSDSATCGREGDAIGDANTVWHPAANYLPWKPIVLDLMRRVEACALDRLVVTRMRPGARIAPHADNVGEYVHDPERCRYHVVLQGLPGSLFRTGDEWVTMLSGQVWWIDPLTEHEAQNNSADDRVHLLVDLRVIPC